MGTDAKVSDRASGGRADWGRGGVCHVPVGRGCGAHQEECEKEGTGTAADDDVVGQHSPVGRKGCLGRPGRLGRAVSACSMFCDDGIVLLTDE